MLPNTLRRSSRVLVVACALASPIGARAADAPPSPETGAAVQALEQAVAAQPDDAVLAFFLATFKGRAGDRDGALDALEQALQHGEGLLPANDVFAALKDDARFVRMQARFDKRLVRRTDGRVVATLKDRLLVPEGIAYDPVGRAFYVGSIPRRAIYRIGAGGSLTPISRPGDDLDEVLGVAIDGPARRLYAVSTSALTSAGRAQPRNAIKAYDLASDRLVATFAVPGARQLNDVAVAPGGVLLVTDSAGGGVWRIDTASAVVSALVPLDAARNANGIAVAASGDVAYVAAARWPLHVELATGKVTPLTFPPREQAAAIDGLYWHDGALIGIQNFTTPARIVRLELAPDGRSVVAVQTLQSHHQRAFAEPTTGAIAPDGFHVLARTYVTRYDDSGRLRDADSIQAPLILRVPLPRG